MKTLILDIIPTGMSRTIAEENLEELLKLFNDYEQSKRDPRAFV